MDCWNEEEIMRANGRYKVIQRVEEGELTMKEGAANVGLSLRQMRRLRRRSEAEGMRGLLHRRSVISVHNKAPISECERILDLRRMQYRGYNLSHFRDVMRERHDLFRSREFYRRLLGREGLYKATHVLKRKARHRKRFEAPLAGMLVQRDTSIHFWIPGASRAWRLILDLDDHSRKIPGALFSEHDDVLSNMMVSWETISTHGVPIAYYTDNNPIYNPLNQKPLCGMYSFYRARDKEPNDSVPQFKRALKELGIEMIHATPYQPQGKGKIERLFRFMQDRLVQEMITAKVKTIEEANKYLKKWVHWYNHCHLHSTTGQMPQERYLAKPQGFRSLPKGIDLEKIFCLKYERQVKADNTFEFEGKTYQIPKNEYRISYARVRVEIRILLSKKVKVFHENREIGCYGYKPSDINKLKKWEDILALQT